MPVIRVGQMRNTVRNGKFAKTIGFFNFFAAFPVVYTGGGNPPGPPQKGYSALSDREGEWSGGIMRKISLNVGGSGVVYSLNVGGSGGFPPGGVGGGPPLGGSGGFPPTRSIDPANFTSSS